LVTESIDGDTTFDAGTSNMDVRKTWLFQANPTKYEILRSLQAERVELWNVRQHAREVRVGDRVLIWLSGDDAGIYALGTILSEPHKTPDSPTGQQYWIESSEGRRPYPRVEVRYDRLLVDRPLSKAYLQAIPGLWGMRILEFPRGTNFPVTSSEWEIIEELLSVA
jgi:predicted RNA-binding protein with PUA-like domain